MPRTWLDGQIDFGVETGGPVSVDMKQVKRARTECRQIQLRCGELVAQDGEMYGLSGTTRGSNRRILFVVGEDQLTAPRIFIKRGRRAARHRFAGLRKPDISLTAE